MPPERPGIDGLSATGRRQTLQHKLQFCVTVTMVTSEYYPHQSADSKNYADLRLQVDASTDRTSLRRPST